MVAVAIVLFVLWLGLAFGWRTFAHKRKTGDTGFRSTNEPIGSKGWWGAVLLAGSIVAFLVGLVTAVAGLDPLAPLDKSALRTLGLITALMGLAATLVAQGAMGASWRIGVDHNEQTGLVTSGAFSLVRNPIFSACLIAAFGLTLMVPNSITVVAFVALFTAIELQVRAVEEPYLRSVHGAAYSRYSSRVGRLVPGVGRLK